VGELKSVELTRDTLAAADVVIVVTDHTSVDYDLVLSNAPLVFDTRNCIPRGYAHIHRL
jgi:UDP-N-acetyl-D-mannosaminuronate dehydrogenase